MPQEISATIARARELAQKKRQSLSTAHVLIALFQSDRQIADLCHQLGFSEQVLFSGLARGHDEHPSGVDLAIERAQKLAAVARVPQPLPLHLLFSVMRDPRSAANAGLMHAGLQPERLTTAAWAALCETDVVQGSLSVAARHGHDRERWSRARARHLDRFRSLALSEETESKLQRTRPGAKPSETVSTSSTRPSRPPEAIGTARGPIIPSEIESRLRGPSAQPDADRTPQPRVARQPPRIRAVRSARVRPAQTELAMPASVNAFALDAQRFPLLTSLGRNLTLLAASGEIDPVIGRERDIEQLLDVLARRRGNNPILVGAPGVGKTAVVEGLALALVEAKTPVAGLPQRVLLEISASSLFAGTGVRGALSERVQALRREVAESAGQVLLFIDEIHGILGGAEGGEGLGSELKTALSRGELPVIGATTDAEYRRIFERDAALARRFTRIEITEPSRADALAIVQALAPKYAAHHRVRYEPSALAAAVELSVRYLPLRQLPDKAIALMDQAAARARRRQEPHVDELAVAQVVSELAQVPVDRLLMKDGEALLGIEHALAQRVVGQSRAIEQIGHALRTSAAGFRGRRPLGSFLFAGPTGVGKTEMAKAISDVLFPGIPLTRIDMSELAQPHAVARLLGAPPGYIGHEEGGQLTEAVRHRPYQLVLLDEIEKAHMDVLLAMLPLLDEGRLTDGRGRTVDFTNTVIVMTSNLGVESAIAHTRIGFGEPAQRTAADIETPALARVRAALPPELWNRIDEPLYFLPLAEHDVAEIARRMLSGVALLLRAEHGVTLEVEPSAIAALLRAGGFDPLLGARPMRRTVSRLVEAPLAQALLNHEYEAGDVITVHGEGAKLMFAPKSVAAETATAS
jgi:ATP-dependent Clp protease ATP-binding subunit ClpC